jgi:F0F1-type ATP synthase assembly protein I
MDRGAREHDGKEREKEEKKRRSRVELPYRTGAETASEEISGLSVTSDLIGRVMLGFALLLVTLLGV